jgi:hypothetical protein
VFSDKAFGSRPLEARRVTRASPHPTFAVHPHVKVSQIVNRDDFLASIPVRQEVIRTVEDVHAVAAKDRRKPPIPPCAGAIHLPSEGKADGAMPEVGLSWPMRKRIRPAQQIALEIKEVFVSRVDSGQRLR